MSEKLYENEHFYILRENATIPWVKIFTQLPYKELSDCDPKTQAAILKAMLIVEETMRFYYNPKMPISSFTAATNCSQSSHAFTMLP